LEFESFVSIDIITGGIISTDETTELITDEVSELITDDAAELIPPDELITDDESELIPPVELITDDESELIPPVELTDPEFVIEDDEEFNNAFKLDTLLTRSFHSSSDIKSYLVHPKTIKIIIIRMLINNLMFILYP